MLNLATQINRRINYLRKYHPPSQSSTRVDNSERLLKVYGGESAQEALNLLVQTAKESRLPADSLSRFLRAGYVPQPMQVRISASARLCDLPDGPTQIGIGGARGPGKSHGTFAQTAVDDCQRIPGLKVLYLRKIQKNAKEQFEDLRRSVLLHVKHEFTNGVLHFYNGSRMFLGHFRNEGDIDQYLGIEYDLIVIEELTTLSLLKYRALRDSNRTSKPGFRPRIYATFNPGGIGHAWVKALFIVPSRKKKETDTRFIFGTVDDNVFNDPDYKKKLEENTGWRLQAYRYGDWDIAAGQYFSTWNHDAIVRPKEKAGVIPGSEVWCSLDKGLRHPTVAYLFCKNEGGIRVVDEHWRQGALTSENAADIHGMLARHGLKVGDLKQFVASPDAFSKDGSDSDKSIADEYGQHGIKLTRANNDRLNGAAQVLNLLGNVAGKPPVPPLLEVSERCTKLIECLPAMQHDPKRPEDVLKVDIDDEGNGGDDPYEAFRYGVMAVVPKDRYSEQDIESYTSQSY
jgi:phage terminase large subunit